jgi:hypothetical protein
VSKAGVEAASAWWSRTLPFKATWSIISTTQEKGMAMANSALKDIAEKYNDVADKVQLLQEVNKIVEHATELKQQLLEGNIDPVVLDDYMTQEVANVVKKLQKEFDKPLPDDKDERSRHRDDTISKILAALEAAFVHVSVKFGSMSEEDARRTFAPVGTVIRKALLIVGMF